MSTKLDPQEERFSLSRWSRRKLETSRTSKSSSDSTPAETRSPEAAHTARPPAGIEGNAELPRRAGSEDTAPRASGGLTAEPAELPPVASLRFDSDFTAFLKPDVDETLKRAALKQLFRDPRFNVMDGLDTYIDDYTQPDPIPSGMLSDIMDRFLRLTQPAEPGRPSQGDEASGPFVSSDSTASGAEGSQSTAGSGDASTAPLTTSEPGNEIPCSAGCDTPSPATEEGTGERAAVAPPERSS